MSQVVDTSGRSLFWRITLLPLRILALGLVVILLVWLSSLIAPAATQAWAQSLNTTQASQVFVGVLVFAVGVSFAAFLWWMSRRFFNLIENRSLDDAQMASLKDLPMALPEGTVRAVLALIVAVVGLPILLFSNVLGLDVSIAGYVNGIITGVFGFYFGTRTSGVPTQAVNQIADERARAQTAEQQRDVAMSKVQEAGATADKTVAAATADARTSRLATALDTLDRQLSLAATLQRTIAPVLPPGLLPAGFDKVVADAQAVLAGVKGVAAADTTEAQLTAVGQAITTLVGVTGQSASPLGLLLSTAAPMLGAVAGMTPLSGLGVLLAIGTQLAPAEYQRWRARVLATPVLPGLIETGTVTPVNALLALDQSPRLSRALGAHRDDAGLGATLADLAMRDDGLEGLTDAYGALFATPSDIEPALTEFQQVLLARRAASDMTANVVAMSLAGLTDAAEPQLRPPPLTPPQAEAIVAQASAASAAATAPPEAHAAFDALITLVGLARRDNVDLKRALAEIHL